MVLEEKLKVKQQMIKKKKYPAKHSCKMFEEKAAENWIRWRLEFELHSLVSGADKEDKRDFSECLFFMWQVKKQQQYLIPFSLMMTMQIREAFRF